LASDTIEREWGNVLAGLVIEVCDAHRMAIELHWMRGLRRQRITNRINRLGQCDAECAPVPRFHKPS
jgi:hypothetical protein